MPIALDLFCGAGGATKGLMRAGFYVVGVDINPQPRYCGHQFVQADAMTFPLKGWDFVWASPPCQRYTALKTVWNHRDDHPDLIAPMRARLVESGVPWVMENVPGAPLQNPVRLCGTAFNLGVTVYDGWRELRRHRLFETSFPCAPVTCSHKGATVGIYGDHARDRRRKSGVRERGVDFPDCDPIAIGRTALGIDWMNWKELSQSIPPAYSEYIARQFLLSLADD